MSETIRVNFGRMMPLFPLPHAVLLPHAVQPLHIFEPRYCQMVRHALDQSGQIAMGTFEPSPARNKRGNSARVRPAVCVGQIVDHKSLPDEQHYILLHGVCRARIRELHEPDTERLYRAAMVEPIEELDQEPPPMDRVRDELRSLLSGPRLSRMYGVSRVLEWFDSDDVPTHALLELIGFTLLNDGEIRYQLLEEPSVGRRADVIHSELARLDDLVRKARGQCTDWPKGMSWN
jgi:Lon protease-like protein